MSRSESQDLTPAGNGGAPQTTEPRFWISPRLLDRIRTVLSPLLVVIVSAAALWLLHEELSHVPIHDVWTSLGEIPQRQVLLALLLTVMSYLVLTGYDFLGLRLIEKSVDWSKVALASFLGFSISNSFGTLVGGSSVRWRLYTLWGLSTVEILKLALAISVTFWIGVMALSSVVFLADPLPIPERLHLPISSTVPLGILLGVGAIGTLALCAVRKTPVTILNWTIPIPPFSMAISQTLLGAVDLMMASGVLYVLLPDSIELSYGHFLTVYLLALVAGILSHVPGGLGVFELVLLVLLNAEESHEVLAALLAYRGIYYLFPLAVGFFILGGNEIWLRRHHVSAVGRTLGLWSQTITPRVFSLAVFAAGAMLLLSGATPGESDRLRWLRTMLPLPAIELSHFLGSIAGILLMILARSLQRRIESAYYATVILLSAGIVFSLVKGFDFEEALILTVMLALFWPCRDFYYRRGHLIPDQFSFRWLAAIGLVLLCAFWLTVFAYKHVEYSSHLWWKFAFSADAPRSLRALAGVVLTLLFLVVAKLFSSRRELPHSPTEEELQAARQVVASSSRTSSHLALLGDKFLLFNDDRSAFVMYGIQGKSWITMGDPVGSDAACRDLAWKFYEASDAADVWPVFYQVDFERVPHYVEMGLTLIKLGEEARVPLADFSLEGSHRRGLRRTHKQFTEAGVEFVVRSAPINDALLAELKQVSDAWLGEKSTAEKGFSLGYFQPDYLRNCPIAILKNHGRIVAFANLWQGAPGTELSIDLMRYFPDAPHGCMEFLFIQLMLWGREQGYQWFNLGMAPLSGVEQHPLAPLWNRAASLAFRHGEHFYNFQGLRQYKDKFDPVWTPKYLACPGGWILPIILTNVATLIAGGMTSLIRK